MRKYRYAGEFQTNDCKRKMGLADGVRQGLKRHPFVQQKIKYFASLKLRESELCSAEATRKRALLC